MEKLFQAYKRALMIHIQSLTTWTQFHKDTERAYETLFDVFHTIAEMKQAISDEEVRSDCDTDGQEIYDLIEVVKSEVEWIIKSNNDIWYDDLLRGHARELTMLCGTFKQYKTETETEETEEEEEETETPKQKNIMNMI